MARVTVEDCLRKLPDRFDLVIVAAQRVRELSAGAQPTLPVDKDKNTVLALREIAEGTIDVNALQEAMRQKYRDKGRGENDEEALPESEIGSANPRTRSLHLDEENDDSSREEGDDGDREEEETEFNPEDLDDADHLIHGGPSDDALESLEDWG
ncbi:MAG: DNA-directed RNA polymerase subunit omega [Magnetococcales bacterium]|nr:DNA-directed RNA polymerase subunit omega [Magnetococcales bacterium]